jgi:enterochelin esterase-like enzyme
MAKESKINYQNLVIANYQPNEFGCIIIQSNGVIRVARTARKKKRKANKQQTE